MHLITTYLIVSSITSILCYPTRPLDERAPELAWQAWLLVDDQNQNQKNTDPTQQLRRRITPKSVFIAPTFSPELLPPCADGYRSDQMGRCIKIIKLDESAHLNFILEKLNEKFAPDFGDYTEYDELEEEIMTDGPEKVQIPLIDGDTSGDLNESTNIAIVVAPTNTNFPLNMDKGVKVDVKRNENDVVVETTTSGTTEETTLETTTMDFEQTTEVFEETTTLIPSTTDVPTETTINVETTTETTQTTSLEPQGVRLTSNPIRFPVDLETNRRFVRFPSDLDTKTTLTTSTTTTTPVSVVLTKRPHESNNHRSRDRNLFVLPTNWNQSSLLQQHKPVVFRFSRKHTYVDTQQFNKRPDYYRTVPSDDLSYIFGFKHKQNHVNGGVR